MAEIISREKFKLNLAKLKKEGENFEIVVDPVKAYDFLKGRTGDIRDVLFDQKIFSDAKRGLLVSQKKISNVFNTEDTLEVAKIILREGDIQLDSDHEDSLRKEKRDKLISMLSKLSVDPKTHAPHPTNRIESALESAKIKIDFNRTIQSQLDKVVTQLKRVIPIKLVMKEMEVTIKPAYSMKIYPLIKRAGRIIQDEWLSDGSWRVIVEIPGGLEKEFCEKLDSFTKGENETRLLKAK